MWLDVRRSAKTSILGYRGYFPGVTDCAPGAYPGQASGSMSSAIQDVTHSSDSGQEGHSQGHRRRASKKRHSPGSQVQDSEAEAEEELEPERTQRYHAK